MFSTKSKTLLALSLTTSFLLSACETTETPPPATSDSYCLLAKRITYSGPMAGQQDTAANTLDTAETVQQIVAHNIIFARTCPQLVRSTEGLDPTMN